MRDRPALFLGLLADQPELVAEVGVLRWRAAGEVGTPGPWIQCAARTAGRDSLPVTLVAMGLEGEVIAAVTLDTADLSDTRDPADSERPEGDGTTCGGRAPWVARMVVRPGERLCGVGRLVLSAAEDLAREHGHHRLWVAADDGEVEFYRHCGWRAERQEDAGATVLSKPLVNA